MKSFKKIVLFSSLLAVVSCNALVVSAHKGDFCEQGSVQVQPSDKSVVVDPEDPEDPEDPVDPGGSTNGDLRIDYISPLSFGKVKLKEKNRMYNSLATKIGNKGMSRGSFIQISDMRETKSGWKLQVKQEHQFKTPDNKELTGAVLSIDKGWANSIDDQNPPNVTRDTLSINNIGQVYDVARADKNKGSGVWSINFGASDHNDDGQPITLFKEKVSNADKESVIRNSAIALRIPDSTKIATKEYATKITWLLSETP